MCLCVCDRETKLVSWSSKNTPWTQQQSGRGDRESSTHTRPLAICKSAVVHHRASGSELLEGDEICTHLPLPKLPFLCPDLSAFPKKCVHADALCLLAHQIKANQALSTSKRIMTFNSAKVSHVYLQALSCPTMVIAAENGWPLSNMKDMVGCSSPRNASWLIDTVHAIRR